MIVRCPDCYKKISSNSEKCIHCGCIIIFDDEFMNNAIIEIKKEELTKRENEREVSFLNYQLRQKEIELNYLKHNIQETKKSANKESCFWGILLGLLIGIDF